MTSSPNQDPARVRRRRVRAGLTQGGLAAQADISQSYMSMLEAGACSASPPVLARLAAALGCEIEELMPDEPSAAKVPA
ncbi:helix-turn-helix domain-containing protein [Streptomyces fuscichromogenes]|uniref:helix-turn-helix domain-containing protein n=1 Tax=Streptomyces fuscichromogenes TaxID=1324013 RepID=UPI00166F7E37|nr:helix-turn-helix transcriptional regulator [Streptomyces fuscichromogenes]